MGLQKTNVTQKVETGKMRKSSPLLIFFLYFLKKKNKRMTFKIKCVTKAENL